MDESRRVMPKPKRGTCSHCGRSMALTKAKRLRAHNDLAAPTNGLPWHPLCPGTGRPPVVAAGSGGEEGP
jgi:hypothetical protein